MKSNNRKWPPLKVMQPTRPTSPKLFSLKKNKYGENLPHICSTVVSYED